MSPTGQGNEWLDTLDWKSNVKCHLFLIQVLRLSKLISFLGKLTFNVRSKLYWITQGNECKTGEMQVNE